MVADWGALYYDEAVSGGQITYVLGVQTVVVWLQELPAQLLLTGVVVILDYYLVFVVSLSRLRKLNPNSFCLNT